MRVWDLRTAALVHGLVGHRAVVLSAKFSPDGKHVASGDVDGTIRLWDLATPQSSTIVGPHERSVVSLAFSPDGSALVSGSLDQLRSRLEPE